MTLQSSSQPALKISFRLFKNQKMKRKKNFLAITIAIAGLATFTTPGFVEAQQPGTKRTELQRHDLSVPGREVIQARVEIEPGFSFPSHRHPGEEIIYVLEGQLEYKVGDQPPVTLKAGDVLYISSGAIHSAKNAGAVNAAELATYIVEKGKPLITIIK
jgi:quercetin dioxygenase-like cupin family protein